MTTTRKTNMTNNARDVRIVILQRGWVMVGVYGRDGEDCWLESAHVIRRWGTTRGLGELVSGPTKTTTLDPAGRVDFHALAVVATIRCEADKWSLDK